MLSTTCIGVTAKSGTGRQSNGHTATPVWEERRHGFGVHEWPDGSRYEGEFVNGFKHGSGRYTWRNGEYYEGSFFRDYRHGDGLYYWPTGHKFIGKFYLNRKEGYGQQLFPDGATFQGLYSADQRFGPGVVSYPDGHQDMGLWLGECLLKLCTSVEEGFSLKNFPEYAAYVDPDTTTDFLTQPPILSSGSQTEARTDSEMHLLSDESFILPPDMEIYSTDGDHLPLPPGRRRKLDQLFHGELWEPDTYPHRGYERDPFSTLPLQDRMHIHIHKHRRQAENVDWDVAALLSQNREGFGPKGPLEVSSELLIQHASQGEHQAVSQILQSGLVHPDVADSRGHTALIAATVNCHNDVIQLLLDMGADIDKLNCEGMSALAVCHVLYYPFQSLHTTMAKPPAQSQVLESPSTCGNSPQNSQVDFSNSRPEAANTTLSNQTNQSFFSDQTVEELTQHISHHSSEAPDDGGELTTEHWPGLNKNETPTDTECLQEVEREKDSKDTGGEGEVQESEESSRWEVEEERKGGERKVEEHDQMWYNGESEVRGQKRITVELREDIKERLEERVRNIHEEEAEERGSEGVPGVERFIQVLDGHIALGSVQWKECGAKAVGRVQRQDKDQTFDSACSISSYNIQVTEEAMQRSAEALSRTGMPQRSDTQETVRKMAAMKIEHRARLNTLKLLLDRGADPNISRIPMSVLFLAVMASDAEAVRRLLLCGARTDIPLSPKRKGLYPLHVAAALPGPAGPRITELLLCAVTDPDAQACDQDEIYEPDKIFTKDQELLVTSSNDSPSLKEGGRTALHVACQRDSDYWNASKVVALLLSHSAHTDLLWSGHSPLSLAIASGNDLAVEELLKGGADPNIPLGHRVGSALCALANVHYHFGGNRAKLLNMLTKAGADILMPVTVGDVVGTVVDYAHYSFNQDLRIANTPFHALNMQEREMFKSRHELLSLMGDLLRQTAGQRKTENLQGQQQQLTLSAGTSTTERFVCMEPGAISSDGPLLSHQSLPHITEKHRKSEFKFCYHCGRSVSVKLTACSRCHKVFYCSKSCQHKAWNERHKEECMRVSASADGIQKNVVFKGPRPLSVKLKSPRAPMPSTMAEKVLESQVNLKENYSFN